MPSRAGRPNKAKQAFRDVLKKYMKDANVDPHLFMVDVIADQTLEMDLRFQAAKELAQYLEPKLRAMEVTGADGGPLELVVESISYATDTPTSSTSL